MSTAPTKECTQAPVSMSRLQSMADTMVTLR